MLALALVLANGMAWGQAGTSTIRGELADPQGKVIPGATVTIKNLNTGFTRSQVTTGAGAFSFELVPPGSYRVEVEAKGFRKKVLSGVHALVGAPTELAIDMEVGSLAETVQVEAAASTVHINTQDATLGNVFVREQIGQLPIEARNLAALLTLQPGVTREGYVTGARSDQSNVTLDGVDINEAQSNSLGFTGAGGSNQVNPGVGGTGALATDHPVLRLNSGAIEEFRVTTLNPNANQGRSSAAQINLVTKSGTNDFHGSLFEFHRNTIFTANDFFNNRANPQIPRPKLIRNTYGGSLGGPFKKDKLFFFYSYEGRRDASEAKVPPRIVPLPHMGQGSMRYTDTSGNTQTLTINQLNQAFSQVGINPKAVAVLAEAAKKYPANDTTVGDGLNTSGFRFNASTPVKLNSNVAKLDWNITSNQTAFIRVNAIYDLTTLVPQFPDTPAPRLWEHPWGLAAAHTWTIGKNWVNSFRYGLTRQSFNQSGDSSENQISFRFVFSPLAFTPRTLSRTTPVHNFVNDTSWVKNNHTIQFGTNIRIIRNRRATFANAFDNAITNPSFYVAGGDVVSDAISSYLAQNNLPPLQSTSEAQNAATALIGRFSQYTANFTFARDGKLLPAGTASNRIFATEEYDWYIQDAWKLRRNLTATLGLRYGVSRPVYETQGFEVKPNIPLSTYFALRVQGAAAGVPFNDLITMELSGPANGKRPMYPWDLNNFQPRAALAWSPNFENSFLRRIFGREGRSVIRTGFAMINDYYGQALAVAFDLNNALGFSSNTTISANTYNITTKPAPLFTGFGQDVRSLPLITLPGPLTYPKQQSAGFSEVRRIESSLDEGLHAPTSYSWNLVFERELPAGVVVQASYVGRRGIDLLATRDVMALNNLADPKSGTDWYTAATLLEKIRQTRPPANTAVTPIPYFENIFPANLSALMGACIAAGNCVGGGGNGDIPPPSNFTPTQTIFWLARNVWANDWTDTQDQLEEATQTRFFFQPQYGALSAWGTIAHSYYHAFALSVRQRFRSSLQWDFNYTYGHSLDDSSGLQSSASYGSAFILNPIRQRDWYASSGFDIRHIINVSGVYQFPFGRGRLLGGGVNRGVDAFIGGWQLSGIFRWGTGLPIDAPFDDARWATNWNVQSNATRTGPVSTCITRNPPKLFGCNTVAAYQSFRNAYPGESGERNTFRLPGYIALDLGLTKAFNMPWSENHKLQLRWEVFNVTNTQHFGANDASRTGYGIRSDPKVRNRQPPSNWSNFTAIQGTPRVMQIGARYEF
jgi:hypothetical protein